MKASRRKELEKIALERLMANGDDPYDYLWGEGADISGKWCPWSKYDTGDFQQVRLKVSIFRGVKNVLVKSRMVPRL